MADDGPPIMRPVPRRPFDPSLTSATPPEEDESPSSSFNQDLTAQRLLNAGFSAPESTSTSISRPQSFLNLTSSTLMGIYSPTASSRDRVFADREDTDTPWGTGAQTPIKRPSVDEATYQLMRDRSHLPRRRSSYKNSDAAMRPSSVSTALSLTMRAALLFMLGIGYGAIVTRFHNDQRQKRSSSPLGEGAASSIITPAYDWMFLVFWGLSGVTLGALLPWFDKVWEDTFGSDLDEAVGDGEGSNEKELGPGTDWALVIRAIGAFVGIVFAIRKLAWASSLQLSVTLALVNPLLWWLIDRSKSGLLLSAAVGIVGSLLLLGVNPEMMPTPSGSLPVNGSYGAQTDPLTLGGLASQETIETGVWMISVLFCSCVCFGNIGRRLAWSKSAVVRGRWGGIR